MTALPLPTSALDAIADEKGTSDSKESKGDKAETKLRQGGIKRKFKHDEGPHQKFIRQICQAAEQYARKIAKARYRPPNVQSDGQAFTKPPTAYIDFAKENRTRITAENPQLKPKEIMAVLGKQWQESSPEVKTQYKQKYKEAMKEYDHKMGQANKTKNQKADDDTGMSDDDDQDAVMALKKAKKRGRGRPRKSDQDDETATKDSKKLNRMAHDPPSPKLQSIATKDDGTHGSVEALDEDED